MLSFGGLNSFKRYKGGGVRGENPCFGNWIPYGVQHEEAAVLRVLYEEHVEN